MGRSYTQQERNRVIYLVLKEGYTIRKAAKELAMPESTAGTWVRKVKNEGFDEEEVTKASEPVSSMQQPAVKKIEPTKTGTDTGKKKVNPKHSQKHQVHSDNEITDLNEVQKEFLIDPIDQGPSLSLEELIEKLTEQFERIKLSKAGLTKYILTKCNIHILRKSIRPLIRNDEKVMEERVIWANSWLGTNLNYAINCVFLGEAEFFVDTKRSVPWPTPGKQDIADKTRALFCAINTTGVVNFVSELLNPDEDKHKEDNVKKDGYCDFIVSTLEMMDDCYEDFESSYLVLDNVPLDQRIATEELIKSHGYGCVFLPSLSSDLNPVENFWPAMKRKLKRDQLSKYETISSRITEAAYEIPVSELRNFCEYSFHKLNDCLVRKPF